MKPTAPATGRLRGVGGILIRVSCFTSDTSSGGLNISRLSAVAAKWQLGAGQRGRRGKCKHGAPFFGCGGRTLAHLLTAALGIIQRDFSGRTSSSEVKRTWPVLWIVSVKPYIPLPVETT